MIYLRFGELLKFTSHSPIIIHAKIKELQYSQTDKKHTKFRITMPVDQKNKQGVSANSMPLPRKREKSFKPMVLFELK